VCLISQIWCAPYRIWDSIYLPDMLQKCPIICDNKTLNSLEKMTKSHPTHSFKLTTYSCKDAKLRRLILWYQQHKSKLLLHLPELYAHAFHLEKVDSESVNKMRYTNKSELIWILEAAETTWKKYRHQKKSKLKQQHITKFLTTSVVKND